jgi:hypothetical protein
MKFFEFIECHLFAFKYEFAWLNLSIKNVLLDYIELQARQLAEKENIPIFNMSFEEMNIGETVENEKAVGKFIYYESKKVRKEHEELFELLKAVKKVIKKDYIPRIEISEKGDVWTIIHELGHYFLYKRNQKQTEEDANKFIVEFFDEYLPPFFKWIYRISIHVRSDKEYNFSVKENYKYYKDYKKFAKEWDLIKDTSLKSQ